MSEASHTVVPIHGVPEQPAKLFDRIAEHFGPDSKISYLALDALNAANYMGAEATQALDFGLWPHLEALAAGKDIDIGQLTNFLHFFEKTADKLQEAETNDPYLHQDALLRTVAVSGGIAVQGERIN